MKKKILLSLILVTCLHFSCRKRDQPIAPYQTESINKNNLTSFGFRKQQVNIVSGSQVFSDQSNYMDIVCGPENNSDLSLIKGCVTMNLPTTNDTTLRRIRLWKAGYGGTRLSAITELKYSTYVTQNCPTVMVLQIDTDNDGVNDITMFFEPRRSYQGDNFPALQFNTWQQWNALYGTWYIEVGNLPEFPNKKVTIQELISIPKYANAQIIDNPPVGSKGEGIRFTIGGTPRELFDNTIGYFDAFIFGTKDQQKPTLFDFTCN